MQTVLNVKPSCLIKGGLAFLLRKGGRDEEKLDIDRNRFHGIVGGVGSPALKPPGGSHGMKLAEPFALG
jgi:hypothetical protein